MRSQGRPVYFVPDVLLGKPAGWHLENADGQRITRYDGNSRQSQFSTYAELLAFARQHGYLDPVSRLDQPPQL